jgi:NDP-sugar pyrophosphorylase family protein
MAFSRRSPRTRAFVIIAGGRGSRLEAVTRGEPKAGLEVYAGVSLLRLLVRKAQQVRLPVAIVAEEKWLPTLMCALGPFCHYPSLLADGGTGTAAALRVAAADARAEEILVCNADTIVPAPLFQASAGIGTPSVATQLLTLRSVQNEGLVGVSDHGPGASVVHWGEGSNRAPQAPLLRCSSSGVYIFDTSFLRDRLRLGQSSLELELIPTLVNDGVLRAVVAEGMLPTFDFGVPHRFKALQNSPQLVRHLLLQMGLISHRDTRRVQQVAA